MKVGNCTRCKRPADYNTPWIDGAGNLVCDNCAKKEDALPLAAPPFQGADQFLDKDGHYVFQRKWCKAGITAWGYNVPGTNQCHTMHAWTRSGRIYVPLTEDERSMHPIEVIRIISEEQNLGMWRCTTCSKKITTEEIAGRPLFAGLNCAKCWEEHMAHLRREKETGNTCRMCGKPRSACYC